MAKLNCPRCGSQVTAEDQFCAVCGAKLNKGALANRPERSPRRQKPNRNILFLIGGAAFVGIALLLALNLLNTGSPPAASSGSSSIEDVHDESGIPYPEVLRIEIGDAKARYDSESAVFVDVRGQSDYAAAHIAGAVSLPLAEIETRYTELPRDRAILTYCT